jgi:hypothetical protein
MVVSYREERERREHPYGYRVDGKTSEKRLCLTDRQQALSLSETDTPALGVRKVPAITLAQSVGEILSFWRVGDDRSEREAA